MFRPLFAFVILALTAQACFFLGSKNKNSHQFMKPEHVDHLSREVPCFKGHANLLGLCDAVDTVVFLNIFPEYESIGWEVEIG
jgi:hypothetical protein